MEENLEKFDRLLQRSCLLSGTNSKDQLPDENAVKFAFLTDLEDETNKLVDPSISKLPTKKPQPVPLAAQKLTASTTQMWNSRSQSNQYLRKR